MTAPRTTEFPTVIGPVGESLIEATGTLTTSSPTASVSPPQAARKGHMTLAECLDQARGGDRGHPIVARTERDRPVRDHGAVNCNRRRCQACVISGGKLVRPPTPVEG